MSNQSHYQQLGLTEDASFEEIQAAKERLKQQHGDDRKVMENIEAAYDAILMDRLRLRQEGKIKVPERIRFPERQTKKAPDTLGSGPTNQGPVWLQNLIDTPSQADIIWPTGIYVVLGAISIIQPSSLQLTLALGVGGCLYFLNRKENKFGRAVLLTVGGLIFGLILGQILSALATGLATEIFITLVTFLVLWMISCFLR
ncbi:CPP1-like family protein [Hydrocoleum sp. CS-953]|uniref:CPP1-like family protein n=1 Tax=Microcoleaceae TaxID=1892252 RepID=UPI000B9B9393|nr:CPP1-like family protein [Hydrocoleum sp. CS-953]OZH55695.1 molecular chaperone DnaJ [Hydrocoleum sp. CS-953]